MFLKTHKHFLPCVHYILAAMYEFLCTIGLQKQIPPSAVKCTEIICLMKRLMM